eukprot:s3939_g2.t1
MPRLDCDRPSGLRTALHLAAYHDSVEVLQLLLDAKANIACAVTPLHECAAADAARAARILARRAVAIREAELDKPCHQAGDDAGKDPGPEAMQDPDAQEEVQWCYFRDPLHAKVDPHGSTPLHLAAENNAALPDGISRQLHTAILRESQEAAQADKGVMKFLWPIHLSSVPLSTPDAEAFESPDFHKELAEIGLRGFQEYVNKTLPKELELDKPFSEAFMTADHSRVNLGFRRWQKRALS